MTSETFRPALLRLLATCAVLSVLAAAEGVQATGENRVLLRSRRQAVSTWASWTVWSPCSRSCGGGVSTRTRNCITRYRYALRQLICVGDDRQFKACNWQDCSPGSQDFREMQCALYDGRTVLGQVVNDWVPYLDGLLPCVLQCYSRDHWFHYNFGKVLDGTPCNTETRNMCIAGKCVHVGCDGVLNSNKTEDRCRVCGGRGTSCTHHTDSYMSDFPPSGRLGYNEITMIPKGATHIEITDRSRNYLALMEKNEYVLNGDWTINWPGKYNAAGTSLKYERTPDDFEKIVAMGPTNDDLHVMVLFRERNPGIDYEYWLPEEDLVQSLHLEKVNVTKSLREGESETKEVENTKNSVDQGKENSGRTKIRTGKKKRKKISGKTRRRGQRQGESSKKCKCKKVRGNVLNHFCQSDFVSHIQVLSKKAIGDSVRVDVSIVQTYRNSFSLMHREYLWIHSSCPCPNLLVGQEYLVMGNLSTKVSYDSRLLLTEADYVRKWKESHHDKIDELQKSNSCND